MRQKSPISLNDINTSAAQVRQQFDAHHHQLRQAIEQALTLAKQQGAAAEVSIHHSARLSTSYLHQQFESLEHHKEGALSITLYKNQRKGSASTCDLSEHSLAQTVAAAATIAGNTSPDPDAGLAPQAYLVDEVADLDLFHPSAFDTERCAEYSSLAEQAALKEQGEKIQSDGVQMHQNHSVLVYGNTHGVLAGYCASTHSLSCSVIATAANGAMERDHDYSVARCLTDLTAPQQIGEKAAQYAIERLNPQRVATGQYPILFAAPIAKGLIGHLASAIRGRTIEQKSSFLLDKLEQQILPNWCHIHEHPHLARGLASAPFDGEGVRTIARDIIQAGHLKTYLHNSYSARRLKQQPTGHAGGIYNWQVQSSGEDFSQLLRKMGTGLLVTDIMGQGVNLLTGDYSRGAAGFWVEGGKIQYPVSELTIAGQLSEMLTQILAIGTDTEQRGSIQTGSILIESMTVASQ